MNFIPHTLAGIPCLIGVATYTRVGPWRGGIESCPSSDDYYGYEECEWEICDRKGYVANWLARKITPRISPFVARVRASAGRAGCLWTRSRLPSVWRSRTRLSEGASRWGADRTPSRR